VKQGLNALGFPRWPTCGRQVHRGDAGRRGLARAGGALVRQLLANLVIEDYVFELVPPPRSQMKFGVVVFPGTWSDATAVTSSRTSWAPRCTTCGTTEPDRTAWTASSCRAASATATTCVRRHRPLLTRHGRRARVAERGGLVWGIATVSDPLRGGLLPGALLRNDCMEFRCEWSTCAASAPGCAHRALGEGRVIRVSHLARRGQLLRRPDTLAGLEEKPPGRLSATATPAASPRPSEPHGCCATSPGREPRGTCWHDAAPERCAEPELAGPTVSSSSSRRPRPGRRCCDDPGGRGRPQAAARSR